MTPTRVGGGAERAPVTHAPSGRAPIVAPAARVVPAATGASNSPSAAVGANASASSAAAAGGPVRVLTDDAALGEKWGALMDAARENRRLRVLLIDVIPVRWSGGSLTLRAATPVLALSIDAARVDIGHLANLVVPGTTSVTLEREDVPQQVAASASNVPTAAEMSEHPLIKQAIELFGGKVTFVQARKPAAEKQ
jgi:hypothetical protein